MPTLLRTNLCQNPSFEVGSSFWTIGTNWTPTFDTLTKFAGSQSIKLTRANAAVGNGFLMLNTSLAINTTYTFSFYTWGTGTYQMNIITNTYPQFNAGTSSAWIRQRFTFTTGATIPSQAIYITDDNLGAPVAGTILYIDGVLLEKSSSLGTYIDGNTADTAFKQFDWTGAPNATTSTESSVLNRSASSYSTSDLEYEFFSRQSGLSKGSLSDHQFKYYKDLLGISGRSLADLELIHFKNQSGLTSGSISDFKSKVYTNNGGSELEYYKRNFV